MENSWHNSEVEVIRAEMTTSNPKQLYYLVKKKNWIDAYNEWILAEELKKTVPSIVLAWEERREIGSDLEETSEPEGNQEDMDESSNPAENQEEASESSDSDDSMFEEITVKKVARVEKMSLEKAMESVIDQLRTAVDKDYKHVLEAASNRNELLDRDYLTANFKTVTELQNQLKDVNTRLVNQRLSAIEEKNDQAEGFKILVGVVKRMLKLDIDITTKNLHICLPDIYEKISEMDEKLNQVRKNKKVRKRVNKVSKT